MILRICRKCGFPITDDLRIAREQAICCCEVPKEGLAVMIASCSFSYNLNDLKKDESKKQIPSIAG